MIEELHRFLLVAKNGNISRTAEKIFMTQSALSQSIQRLEKELNTKLFVKKGKALHLTTAGAGIVEIGTKIIELWERAKNPNSLNLTNPTITIGAFDNAAIQLGKYFQNYSKKDKFNLELIIDSSGKLISKLQLGVLDVGICVIDKKSPPEKNLILLQTFNDTLTPVSSKIFREKIDKIPFILYSKDSKTRMQIDEIFTENSIQPNIIAESTSITFMKELAMLGVGIALLPENYIQAELKQGLLKKQKLPITWRREYGIFLNKDGFMKKDNLIIEDLIKNLTAASKKN